jgi:sugar diacid utilization regulator
MIRPSPDGSIRRPAHGSAGPPRSRTASDLPQRAGDVLAMHQLCRGKDSLAAILRWLTRRTGCWVGLLDRSGTVLVDAVAELDPAASALVIRSIETMFDRGLRSFATETGPAGSGLILALDAPAGGPVLVFCGSEYVPRSLAADAATLLGTCWWAEETRRIRHRVDDTEARSREVVLHLLTSRNTATASQIAAALSPPLPDPVRVHVIECAADERDEVLRRCAELTGHSAWIVRCPVHVRHVLVVAAAHSGRPGSSLEVALTADVDGCVVGTGGVVALRDTVIGYEQAFHALAVARGRPERWARFDAQLDVATLVGRAGLPWATALLAPLITHVPARRNDPDAAELTATARSWLSFSTAATRHLKIHRNTLVARLGLIEELLGLDLGRVAHQAVLDLALRVRAAPLATTAPDDGSGATTLDDLLRSPAVREWALAILRPIRDPALGSTLRVWLDNDARLSVTAVALGVSVPGARKRLCRLEQVLSRSLLQAPNARHDLWLAVRAANLACPAGQAADG